MARGRLWKGGIVVFLVLVGAFVLLRGRDATHRAASSLAPVSAPAVSSVGLDLLRVEPVGSFVAAGHATPGEKIALRDAAGAVLAEGLVDGRGEWLLSSRDVLKAGSHELFVFEMRDGASFTPTDIVAVLDIPAMRGPRPLALRIVPGQAPLVLQSPDGPAASAGLIEAAEFSEKGALTLGGRADPGTQVYIYLDDAFLGEASADSQGRWIRDGGGDRISPEIHKIRIDVLAIGGDVALRGAVVFGPSQGKFAGLSVLAEEKLWRIRRQARPKAVQELIVFRPGAVEMADPKPVLPGQMISPRSIPPHPNP